MSPNLHHYDRVLRIVAGAVLMAIAFFSPGELWYVAGLVALLTGAVGMCPVYRVLNISTKK